VRTLVNQWLPGGEHQVSWNGRCEDGRQAASGAYFALLSTPRGSKSQIRMLLIK
jgi:hypothetical protein